MDANKQVDNVEKRVQQLEASASAAARKNQKQLKKRFNQTQADAGQVLSEAKQDLTTAASKAKQDECRREKAQGQLSRSAPTPSHGSQSSRPRRSDGPSDQRRQRDDRREIEMDFNKQVDDRRIAWSNSGQL